ncbi:hypothetical protein FHS79_000207 [Polymorphobacter multimanifer]|uniref:Uncharacterized protein n=1 Tax=Polymorphobacter multimanifer TaxID=1070431 RepID=A0A841L150_9SPHN|nr:hypothetical protein [Polymorphobacter multimanifer]MBB6226056.1 hypothetical protein [Polymorphobacter multimanifer]
MIGAAANVHAFVVRGKNEGMLLFPHKHSDGKFVVSATRFEIDYIRVDEAGIVPALERGLKLRMSNPQAGLSAASLVRPSAIYRPVLAS